MHPILAMGDEAIAVIAIGGGLLVAIVGIVAGATKSLIRARMTETSRREIAAYVAEGSITPEEGERLLKASPQQRGGCC